MKDIAIGEFYLILGKICFNGNFSVYLNTEQVYEME